MRLCERAASTPPLGDVGGEAAEEWEIDAGPVTPGADVIGCAAPGGYSRGTSRTFVAACVVPRL